VGVVRVGRGLRIEQVNARALELCGCADATSFDEAWEALACVLRPSLEAPSPADDARPLLVDLGAGRRVEAELHRLGAAGGDHLVLLRDPRALEAVEDDARLLRQLDGLGRVYRTLAHELRAPLGAVMLNLDLLQESVAGGGWNERARRCIRVLREELQRLNRSLHGIVTQTVPEAAPQEFDVTASLSDLVALLAPQARRQAVELDLRVGQGALRVRGYPDRLRQAFLNVAVNALEAMPRGGRLTVEARRDGRRVLVALRDTGPGIPRDALPRVYDPDFTTKQGGSGIGLHVARAVVELHGGEIGVASRPGRGTEVRVAVPLSS
jgi:signal transduction histidine kinase